MQSAIVPEPGPGHGSRTLQDSVTVPTPTPSPPLSLWLFSIHCTALRPEQHIMEYNTAFI